VSKLLWVLYFLCLTGGLLQNFAQFLHKIADHDGFGQKAIHAAFRQSCFGLLVVHHCSQECTL